MKLRFGKLKFVRDWPKDEDERYGYITPADGSRELYCHMNQYCGFRLNSSSHIVFGKDVKPRRNPIRGEEIVYFINGGSVLYWGLKDEFVTLRDSDPPRQPTKRPSQRLRNPPRRADDSYGGGTELY